MPLKPESTKPCITQETWTLQNSRQKLVNHYAVMALNPAMLGQARWRVKELEAGSTGQWTGIAKEVAARIEELKAKHGSKKI